MEEIISMIEENGIKIRYDPIQIFFGLFGYYENNIITIGLKEDFLTLMHELCHALEDKIGSLDPNYIETGELTAGLFSEMMLFNQSEPFKILPSALKSFFKTNDGSPDVKKAMERALVIYNHPLSYRIRKQREGFKK